MKSTKILYWIFTILFAALMLFSSIPDILKSADAMTFMRGLGYPDYIDPFLGWAKVIGVVFILLPMFPRVKEWAYAGLIIDLVGAFYSQIAQGGFQLPMLMMLVFILMGSASYYYWHKLNDSMKKT